MNRRYDDPAEMPLFGEPRPVDRVLNLMVGAFTAIVVLVTLISALAFEWPPNGVNVFFACIIVFICASHLFLIYWFHQGHLLPIFINQSYINIYWYRQGDLEPRFRSMIFYNAFTIILLCVCGNLYIHGLGCPKT